LTRVEIAPRAATAFLWLLICFAAGGLLIGALLIGGAGNIAKAQGGSSVGYIVAGAVLCVLGAVVLAYARRQLGAVREIVVDERGWTLVDRRGRSITIARGANVELFLRCRREVYTVNSIPRIRDVVEGTLTSGTTSKLLAPSGPVTYAKVLPQLGVDAAPPARGHTERHRVVV
jgi:hypothetical protein